MKYKLLGNLFILIAMGALAAAVVAKFFGIVLIFPKISPLAHLVFANTCLLIALILKLAND